MKYNYTKEGYHPGEVSFEVSAMLLEEAKLIEKPHPHEAMAHQSNYARGDYARDQELSFNTVTDKAATVKYIHHKHNHAALHYYIQKLKKEKERAKAQKQMAKAALIATKKSLSAVLQSMLTKFSLARHKFKHGKGAPKSFLHSEEINHILYATHHAQKIEKERAKAQVKIKVKAGYSLHPHVDALLRERAQAHYLGLSR